MPQSKQIANLSTGVYSLHFVAFASYMAYASVSTNIEIIEFM
jgi:hypothetical protein